MTWQDEIHAAMKRWLLSQHSDAAKITRVEAYSTDWSGDSEAEFYSESLLTIHWVDIEGRARSTDVEGNKFQMMWDALLGDSSAS